MYKLTLIFHDLPAAPDLVEDPLQVVLVVQVDARIVEERDATLS